jgi:hypothetical protein
MDTSEQLAERYLASLSLGDVVYEPDGNVPPDFVVGGAIAVEVRRLNQNHEVEEGKTQGLEEIDIPLRHRMQKHLREFAPSRDGECWYVGYDFKRPVESWKVLRPVLDRALQEFYMSPIRQRMKLKLTRHFSIDFVPASIDRGSFFLLGANMDYDSGGWVVAELERNLRICIAEKERKISTFRSRYPAWWLVLEDRIDYAVDSEDRPRFKSEVMSRIEHTFDRIVLLDPRDYRRAFEVSQETPSK